jgi:hypothetical protein
VTTATGNNLSLYLLSSLITKYTITSIWNRYNNKLPESYLATWAQMMLYPLHHITDNYLRFY